nr:MAG TPA: serine/threonine-protein kinase [Caudoviricetes sp.]
MNEPHNVTNGIGFKSVYYYHLAISEIRTSLYRHPLAFTAMSFAFRLSDFFHFTLCFALCYFRP